MAQAPVTPAKHTEPVHHDAPKKTVGEPGALVMPLAEPGPGKPTPTIGVKGEPIDDGERDPDTIAEEQRRRSDEYVANLEAEAKKHAPPPPAPEHHTSKK